MSAARVIVIGGGASGLAAAIAAAEGGASVTVLESAAKPGRKLLATGNGRCNLMNTGTPVYFGGKALAERVTGSGAGRLNAFFDGLGLVTAEEDCGRVYPACGQASAVLEVLMYALHRLRVKVICGVRVKELLREKDGFLVRCEGEDHRADRVILCCGGMAGLHLGHDGSAYSLLTRLGHTLVPPRPALCPIETDKPPVQGLKGLRCPVRLLLTRTGHVVDASRGEALFTEYGISGVCAMQLSARAEKGMLLYADFSPLLFPEERGFDHGVSTRDGVGSGKDRCAALLKERSGRLGWDGVPVGLLPELLRKKLSGIPEDRLAELLTAYPMRVMGTRGFDQAQVTRGGWDTGEFDPDTLESRIVPGCYACGEALDVDGDCGGFNLQFAFLSGITAGWHAAGSGA